MEKKIGANRKDEKSEEKVRPTFWDGPKEEPAGRTTERLGDVYHISKNTVQKYGTYSSMVEMLRSIVPEYVPLILNGTMKISHENLLKLVHMSEGEIRRYFEQLTSNSGSYIRYNQTRDAVTESLTHPPKQTTVKDMPAYDPDADLSSLAFTMPSWAGSIRHALKATDMTLVSVGTKNRLSQAISILLSSLNELQEAIKEDSHG